MTTESWPTRVARILPQHGVSMSEYYLLCTAGYRVNVERETFIEWAAGEFQGSTWPVFTRDELASELTRLVEAGVMTLWTDSDVQEETARRAASALPELDDGVHYEPGHVDFTGRGYLLYRRLIQAIHGDDFFQENDAGFNLDPIAERVDVYAVSAERCQRLMDQIQADGDSHTGAESTTFVAREGPTRIGEWKPNRFSRCAAGYHGVLRYVSGAAEPPVAGDGAAPRR
jgi:hypothetical protein